MAEVRSGSFNTSGYSDPGYPDHYTFSWSLVSQSIVDNTSTISWSLKGAGGSSSGYFTNVREKYVTVNGSTNSNSNIQATYNGTTPFSGTTAIKHNSNGKASFSASAGGAFYYYGSYNSTGSGTWDLPTIARATTPTLSATSVTMGNSINITLSPADSSFKHKIRYSFGGVSESATGVSIGYDFTAQGNSTVTFTPPTSLGSQIPNSNSGTCTIYCYTYNSSGTHIGTITKTLTLNVPSYNIGGTVAYITNGTLNGAFVQNKSYISVETNITSNLYGATIKSYTSNIDGVTYSGANFNTKPLSAGTYNNISVVVTDSRNKTATLSVGGFTVYAYANPQITSFTLERQSDGTTVIAKIKGSISAINNKNSKAITVTLNGTTNTITSSSYTIDASTTFTNVPTDNTLVAKVTFADAYNTVSKEAVLPTVAVTMDFYKDGNGIAMGKVAEQGNLLDVAWEIKTGKPAKTLNNFSYRGTNLISTTASDTVQNWSDQGNLATTFYTEQATELTKPSTWGFLLNVTTGPNSAEAHHLWLEQSNGSIYHRGGNTSGFGAWKKILDNSNCADYVIERGTSNGWEYTKWNSGKMELFGEKSLSFPASEKQTDYLYRSIVSLDLSSLLTNIMSGTCAIQTNGMVPLVCRHSSYHTTAEIVIVTSRTFSAFTITAPIYIIGKWK